MREPGCGLSTAGQLPESCPVLGKHEAGGTPKTPENCRKLGESSQWWGFFLAGPLVTISFLRVAVGNGDSEALRLKAHLWRGCPGVVSRAVAVERQSSDSRVILHTRIKPS